MNYKEGTPPIKYAGYALLATAGVAAIGMGVYIKRRKWLRAFVCLILALILVFAYRAMMTNIVWYD
jgi:hypothetical protein